MNGRLRLVAAILVMPLAACDVGRISLTLAVTTEEPAPSIAENIAATLAASGIDVEIFAVPDAAEALTMIERGEIDLSIIEEPERPVAGLRTLAPLYPSVLHVLHNNPEPPDTFDGLISGRRIYAGPPGSTAYRLFMEVAESFGVTGDAYQLLDNPWTVRPDVFFVFGGLLSAESIEGLEGYRLFSFGDRDDIAGGSVADAIALRQRRLSPFLLPKRLYPAIGNDAVLTLSIRSVLAASESLDSETAYAIAETLFTNAQEYSLGYSLVTSELDEDLDATTLMLPLHAGTRRYLGQDRPGYIERNVDVLALYFTIAITLLSATIAWYRHRLQVRKDRVDAFHGRLLDIRRDMLEAADENRFSDCRTRAVQVQREVLDLLIDERIAADASLVTFINLSNQLINEADRGMDTVRASAN